MSSNSTEIPAEWENINEGPQVIRAMTALMIVATIFVGLRLGVRRHRRAGMGMDDWLIVGALLFGWAEYVAALLSVVLGGVGVHLLVALEHKPNAVRDTYLHYWWGELAFFVCIAMIKWSILAMYYRIFPTRFMKWGYIVLGAMTAAWWIAVMFVTIFQCTPPSRMWDRSVPGTCINQFVFYLSTNGVPNIIMDAMILCLPVREIYNLQISKKYKIAIAVNFLLGGIVIAASIKKLVVMIDIYNMNSSDTYYLADLTIWVTVEPCLGIVSACLPVLRPILTWFLRLFGLAGNGSSNEPSARKDLVTFGNTSGRMKHGYRTTTSLEHDEESTEHLNAWPKEHNHNKSAATTTARAAEDEIQLHNLSPTQPQFIAVTTELEWRESREPHAMRDTTTPVQIR